MALPNIFTTETANNVIARINQLSSSSQPQWGKMSIAQMLAHCNVTYEMMFEDKHRKASGFKKIILKWFVKPIVVGEKPYKKNSPTAPEFLVSNEKDFENEKNRLINYIQKVVELGENSFDGKESHSFGKLNKQEWNNMMYKHLDHHLTQFGA